MSDRTAAEVRARFDGLLAATDAHYKELERERAAGREVGPELDETTKLIEILESMTYDGVRRVSRT